MTDNNTTPVEEGAPADDEINNPETQGKKAIEADKKSINKISPNMKKRRKKSRMQNNGVMKADK